MGSFRIKKMILRSLFSKPVTTSYPAVPREYGARTRGHISVDMEACILCGICGRKCPTDAIQVDRAEKEWRIARMQCIQCGSCVENCPKHCLTMENTYTAPSTEKQTETFRKEEQTEKKEETGGAQEHA